MKKISTNGHFTKEKSRPDTFDITKRAKMALRHIFEMSDKNFNYVTYIGASLGEDPPHFVHHKLGWTEALPYSVVGSIIGRKITGETGFEDVQFGQRSLLLSHFNELDGFVHAPESPWNGKYPMDIWEQARTLYALIYWFMDTKEDKLLFYADGLVDGLFEISKQVGVQRVFPKYFFDTCSMGPYGIGAVIDPLLMYYELTGNTKALIVGLGTNEFYLDPKNGFFDGNWGAKGFFRTIVACLNGFSKAASLTGDVRLLNQAKLYHDNALSRCTTYGSTPCGEPACSDFELNSSALYLIQSGYNEYWDQIDRFVRNQTAESQFLNTQEWVKEKASKKRINKYNIYDGYPDELQILPYDDYRDIVNRSIGGCFWCSPDEHLYFPASLMICCTSHLLRSVEIVWNYALVETPSGITVNLHYNMENTLGEVISYEPYEGKVSIILKKNAETLRVRLPEYTSHETIKAMCDEKKINIRIEGNYAIIENAIKGQKYSFLYSLNIRETMEKQNIYAYPDYDTPIENRSYTARWRGNTVVHLSPETNNEKRLYKRDELDNDFVRLKNLSYFINTDNNVQN